MKIKNLENDEIYTESQLEECLRKDFKKGYYQDVLDNYLSVYYASIDIFEFTDNNKINVIEEFLLYLYNAIIDGEFGDYEIL